MMIIKDFQGYEAEVVINVCSAIIANLGSIWVRFNAALLTFFLSSSDHLW